MEDMKDRDERINAIKFDMNVEELESRIAPVVSGDGGLGDGRVVANHNETMLLDDTEIEELESRIAPSVSGGASGDGRISFNHNETMLLDSI
jgi:hypothetical protein